MAVDDYECPACNATFAAKADPSGASEPVRCPACGRQGAQRLPSLGGLGHHRHGRQGGHLHADHAERSGGLGLGCGKGGFGCGH
jgi:putative FmdB family regulatory protein